MDEFKLNIYPDEKTYSREFIEQRRKQLKDGVSFYAKDWDGYAIITGICGNESKYEFLNKYALLCCDSEIADCKHKYSNAAPNETRVWVEDKVAQMSETEFWKAVALSNIYWKAKYQNWYEKETSRFKVSRDEFCQNTASLYYDEDGEWKLAGRGHIDANSLPSSVWEQKKEIWIMEVSFERDFCKKFQDSNEWPTFKMVAIVSKRGDNNDDGLSTLYVLLNNAQVKSYLGGYIQAMLLRDENGILIEAKC